jgi:hypothetical protein
MGGKAPFQDAAAAQAGKNRQHARVQNRNVMESDAAPQDA